MRVVELPLLDIHVRIHHRFELIGQIGEHVGLQAAQHEGGDDGLQPASHRVVAAHNGRLEALAKARIRSQQPGHEEVKNAPQLRKAVFHRRARERELVVGFKAFHRARRERRGVFDILRLVERAYEQAAARPIVDIDTKQVI